MSANDYHLSYTRQQATDVCPPKDVEGGPTESSDEDDYGNRPAKRPRNFVARQVSRAVTILEAASNVVNRHVKPAGRERLVVIKTYHVACARVRGFSVCTWKGNLPSQ